MTINFNNVPSQCSIGTTFQGYVLATFEQITEIFGEPDTPEWEDGKTTTEWTLKFEDGPVFTIYDYCKAGCRDGSTFSWHIGGFESAVADRVRDLVEIQQ